VTTKSAAAPVAVGLGAMLALAAPALGGVKMSALFEAAKRPAGPIVPVTRLEIALAKGVAPDAARTVLESRLRIAGIPVVEVLPAPGSKAAASKPGAATMRVRVAGYRKETLVRSLVEAGELLSVFLVDDLDPFWTAVPLPTVAGGKVDHRVEALDKWHAAHTLVDESGAALPAYVATLKPSRGRRFLTGPAGAHGRRAVLVVDPPPLTGLRVTDAHVAADTSVYATLVPEDARHFADVTAVHSGARLALALGEELVLVAKVATTVTDGHLVISSADRAAAGDAETLARRLNDTRAASGLVLRRVVLE
jgi:hypothetical protein